MCMTPIGVGIEEKPFVSGQVGNKEWTNMSVNQVSTDIIYADSELNKFF
jgi:hypothetical protein